MSPEISKCSWLTMIVGDFNKLLISIALVVSAAGATLADLPKREFPRVGEYEILCGDFHTHTSYSDGGLKVAERLKEEQACGYNVVAITDHGTDRGCREAEQVGRSLGMIVISGFETGTRGQGGGEHLVVFGVPPSYEVKDGHTLALTKNGNRLFYQDELKSIAAAGGIIIYAHPSYGSLDASGSLGTAEVNSHLTSHVLPEAVVWGIQQGYIAGIEVQNGWGDVDICWGVEKWNGIWCYPHSFYWALQHNLALFANTDVHGRNAKPDQPVTLVFVTRRNTAGVMEAVRARRTIAWFNGVLWGREKLLSELVRSAVVIKQNRKRQVLFENKSPITLKCSLASSPDKNVEIGPYASVATDWKAEKSMNINWTNLWTSLGTNLETRVKPELK